jgi:hypothetical protein
MNMGGTRVGAIQYVPEELAMRRCAVERGVGPSASVEEFRLGWEIPV